MAMPPTNQVVQREDARNCALACVTTALRRLAANTIDLARGRGRPADLEEEAELLLVSLDAYVQAVGELPSAAVLGEALLRSLETICDGPGGIATFGVASDRRPMIMTALDLTSAIFNGDRLQGGAGRPALTRLDQTATDR